MRYECDAPPAEAAQGKVEIFVKEFMAEHTHLLHFLEELGRITRGGKALQADHRCVT